MAVMEYKILFWGNNTTMKVMEDTLNEWATSGWRVVCSVGNYYIILEHIQKKSLSTWNVQAEHVDLPIPVSNCGGAS
jgi:hypothetical protein